MTRQCETLTKALALAILLSAENSYSPVAQLAEQVAVNHWVRCSNHRGGENELKAILMDGLFYKISPTLGSICAYHEFFEFDSL